MNPWQQLLDRASEPTTRTPADAPEKRKAPENLELEVGKRIGEWTLLKFRFGQSTPSEPVFRGCAGVLAEKNAGFLLGACVPGTANHAATQN